MGSFGVWLGIIQTCRPTDTQTPLGDYIKPNKKALMNKLPLLSSLLIGCALLSGCAAELLSNSEKLIIVKGRPSQQAEAAEIAETECQKRGRMRARLISKPAPGQYGFECVR
ncbi:hypothetical protein SAMN05216350_101394 [Polaromonas sp. YR568]|nr:hypothetical protein SAMN05216350_101394 [Polaromonas sp. YR568]